MPDPVTPAERVEHLQTHWGDNLWFADLNRDGMKDAAELVDLEGRKLSWNASNVTYTIAITTAPDDPDTPGVAEADHFVGPTDPPTVNAAGEPVGLYMTEAAKDAARRAFELWDDLIAIELTEGPLTPNAGISIAYFDLDPDELMPGRPIEDTQTHTQYTNNNNAAPFDDNEYAITARRVWIEGHDVPPDDSFNFGRKGMWTFMHEIGHALGLSHPSLYELEEGEDPRPFTYAADAAHAQDTKQYSVMSYFGRWLEGADGIWRFDVDAPAGPRGFPQTPMLDDVGAIQAKYDPDLNTRSGDTRYGFGSTADRDVFDFEINPRPILTIWDGGGVDTLSASGFSQDQVINLAPGSYSSIGPLIDNIAIAFGCTLENAVGGGGDDTITGNAAGNLLQGGGGNDTIDGTGSEIVGTEGLDGALYSGFRSEYDIRTFETFIPGRGGVLVTSVAHVGGTGTDGTDYLMNIDIADFHFGAASVNIGSSVLGHTSNLWGVRFDDVLLQNRVTGEVFSAVMHDGAFARWEIDTQAMGQSWRAMAAGDVNPGLTSGAEVFVQNVQSGAILYASLDTGKTSWGVVSTGLTADWKLRAVADVTHDASVDAIVQNETTGTIFFADMKGGTFQGWGVVSQQLTADWKAIGAGDLDGNGFADVVIQNQQTGTTLYARIEAGANGSQFGGWGVVSQALTPEWIAKAVADVDGDGFADVVFQNQQSAAVIYADMKAGAFGGWQAIGTLTPDWNVQATADVNNDGCVDVIVQDATNGTTLTAIMAPSGFDHWGVVTQNITSDWVVV